MHTYLATKFSSYESERKFLAHFIKEETIFSYTNLSIYLVTKSFVTMKQKENRQCELSQTCIQTVSQFKWFLKKSKEHDGQRTTHRFLFRYGSFSKWIYYHTINRNLKYCRFKIRCFPRSLHKAILLNEIWMLK